MRDAETQRSAPQYAVRMLLFVVCSIAVPCRAVPCRVAEREGALNLTFIESLGDAPVCEILLSAGALQFVEHSIPELLESLPAKPRSAVSSGRFR